MTTSDEIDNPNEEWYLSESLWQGVSGRFAPQCLLVILKALVRLAATERWGDDKETRVVSPLTYCVCCT